MARWCDECGRFTFAAPEGVNPCAAGRAMGFRMPRDELDMEWGFFRVGCADRTPMPPREPPDDPATLIRDCALFHWRLDDQPRHEVKQLETLLDRHGHANWITPIALARLTEIWRMLY